jgi:radical SAM protein with 4Fe4S-binding SPASM domain
MIHFFQICRPGQYYSGLSLDASSSYWIEESGLNTAGMMWTQIKKCRTCEVRYICGGICKAWVNDKKNVDSGDFDCSSRKKYFLQPAEKITSKQNDCFEVVDERIHYQDCLRARRRI